MEKANPCFRKRKVESPYPGYLLSQHTFQVGTIKGVGRIWLQAVVDTDGSFAFGSFRSRSFRRQPWIFFMTGFCRSTRIKV